MGGEAIPEGLSQVTFWIIRRNADGLLKKPQFTPIAILAAPGQPTVMGRMPGQDWMPYPQLLTKLTGRVRGDEEKYEDDQKRSATVVIRETLGKLAGMPVVAMAYVQNARSRWDFLGDGRIVPDKIQFGDGPVQRIAVHCGLRLIRVRDGLREETPRWWASNADGPAGLSVSFWPLASDRDAAEDDRRVFYGTAEKGAPNKGRTAGRHQADAARRHLDRQEDERGEDGHVHQRRQVRRETRTTRNEALTGSRLPPLRATPDCGNLMVPTAYRQVSVKIYFRCTSAEWATASSTVPGTAEILRMIVGRVVTGLDAR